MSLIGKWLTHSACSCKSDTVRPTCANYILRVVDNTKRSSDDRVACAHCVTPLSPTQLLCTSLDRQVRSCRLHRKQVHARCACYTSCNTTEQVSVCLVAGAVPGGAECTSGGGPCHCQCGVLSSLPLALHAAAASGSLPGRVSGWSTSCSVCAEASPSTSAQAGCRKQHFGFCVYSQRHLHHCHSAHFDVVMGCVLCACTSC